MKRFEDYQVTTIKVHKRAWTMDDFVSMLNDHAEAIEKLEKKVEELENQNKIPFPMPDISISGGKITGKLNPRFNNPTAMGCVHGRAVGQPCPHCLGINNPQ